MSAELVNFMGRGGVQGPVMVDNRLIFIIIIRIRLWCVRGRQSQGKLRSWYEWGEGWWYDQGGDVWRKGCLCRGLGGYFVQVLELYGDGMVFKMGHGELLDGGHGLEGIQAQDEVRVPGF